MTQHKPLAQDWAVSDACRAKIRIRYEIKQLEYHLKRFVANHPDLTLDLDELTQTCQALAQHYHDYLEFIRSEHPTMTVSAHPLPTSHTQPHPSIVATENRARVLPGDFDKLHWQDCYRQLETIKSQWRGFPNDQDWAKLYEVSLLYQHLAQLCHCKSFKAMTQAPPQPLLNHLNPLIQANTPETWLNSITHLANQGARNTLEHAPFQLSQLDSQTLIDLFHLFSRTDVIEMTHTIFFYQLYPEQLLVQPAHPEKMISAKTRLASLYDVIKCLHQSITHALIQKGQPPIPEYLFHTDDLPKGIEIQINTDYRASVLLAVKSLRTHSQLTQEPNRIQPIQAIFRAYKYWFNPSRLIDAVMILRQQSTAQTFEQKISALYQQLSVNECLDLYGYFSNKDTCYFMRTLLAVQQDLPLDWIQAISPQDKKTIDSVYQTLECVMNALRDELNARHFKTKAYKRRLNPEKIAPGRRNRQAVSRIILLYARTTNSKNTKIDALFNAIETN